MAKGDEDRAVVAAATPDGEGPPQPLAIAGGEMVPGERLIWADRSTAASARRRVLPVSLLGWLFLLLSLAWMAKAAIASFWFLIMGLPFLAAALAIALLPWWWPKVARQTVYAISDRRLLIIRNWPRRQVTSYGPEDIDVIERREGKDGSGDLVFRREEYRKLGHHHDPRGKRRVGDRAIGFFGVPDVRRLEEAVWNLKMQKTIEPSHDDAATSDRADRDAGSPAGDGGQAAIEKSTQKENTT